LGIFAANLWRPASVLPSEWAAGPGEDLVNYYFDTARFDYKYDVEQRKFTISNSDGEVELDLSVFKQQRVDLVFKTGRVCKYHPALPLTPIYPHKL
jgi:hypothetical protein